MSSPKRESRRDKDVMDADEFSNPLGDIDGDSTGAQSEHSAAVGSWRAHLRLAVWQALVAPSVSQSLRRTVGMRTILPCAAATLRALAPARPARFVLLTA